jgi:putative zinc finger/helix-turn-helix YgiT family protein
MVNFGWQLARGVWKGRSTRMEEIKMKKILCPICDNPVGEENLVKREEEFVVRGETIHVQMECYKCSISGRQPGAFEQAYRLYRANHKMLQPEEIRAFRRKYDLTQRQLSVLLGFGGATLSRYETGALQSEAHDKVLQYAMDPDSLVKLIEAASSLFSVEGRKELLSKIKATKEPKADLIENCIVLNLTDYDPNEFNGFKRFDREKFTNSIIYLCKEGTPKTKLNKLLYYADFKHFKEHAESITGTEYAHLPFGPAPDHYNLYFSVLALKGLIKIEETEYGEYQGERIIAVRPPDLNIFSETELQVLAWVKEFFKSYTAGSISKFSHAEKGYQNTKDGELISYSYARALMV